MDRIFVDQQVGLSSDQVRSLKENGLSNQRIDSSTKSVKEIVKSNVFTYFNMIFLVLGVLLAIVGAWKDMLFLFIIIANTGIGIIQEIHSKKVLDQMSLLNAAKTKVVRNGLIEEVVSDELVRDDIVVLEAGNQIPADAVVLSGQVRVNEALLTGETDEILKQKGDALLSGSFVVSGQVYARLEQVGAQSYISKLTMQATKTKEGEQSEMIRSLTRLIQVVGILIVPVGIALFVQAYFLNESSFRDSITGMVAAVIGMIPEGLFLLASVAMAVSAVRLARQQVLIHDMKCIETLARVNVLCVDKTGTITEPGMMVYHYEPIMQYDELWDDMMDVIPKDELYRMITKMVSQMPSDNATMEALQTFFIGEGTEKAKKVIGFSSETKYSGAMFSDVNYVLGAPELLLKNDYGKYEEQIEKHAKKGYRVLAFGKTQEVLEYKPLEQAIEPLGFVALSNPIRKGAKETFQYFANRGVAVKVISGDNPVTVSAIAEEAGIQNAEKYVDASTLKTKADIKNAMGKYTVFGRVTPEQKRLMVQALKAQKKTVAMTGDGVNDVLALRDADCSIAMASGSDAASQVAQLVLMDSDFSRMPGVVMEGRRVVNNIERTAALYIVKNIFSMLLAIFSVILMFDYPLQPTQVSLISTFTIGIPTFFLALEPNKERIQGHFLTNVMVKALPAGLTDFLVVSGLVIFCREFGVDQECFSTSCTILVAVVGFMILYRIAKPMTRGHIILLCSVIFGWLFCMLFVGDFFGIKEISTHAAMLTFVFALITEPALRYLSQIVEWLHIKLKHL